MCYTVCKMLVNGGVEMNIFSGQGKLLESMLSTFSIISPKECCIDECLNILLKQSCIAIDDCTNVSKLFSKNNKSYFKIRNTKHNFNLKLEIKNILKDERFGKKVKSEIIHFLKDGIEVDNYVLALCIERQLVNYIKETDTYKEIMQYKYTVSWEKIKKYILKLLKKVISITCETSIKFIVKEILERLFEGLLPKRYRLGIVISNKY